MTKAMKKSLACVFAVLMLTSISIIPAFAAGERVGGMSACNRTSQSLGGTWHYGGNGNSAYSNYYHPSYYHNSNAGFEFGPTGTTGYASAGSWSYGGISVYPNFDDLFTWSNFNY